MSNRYNLRPRKTPIVGTSVAADKAKTAARKSRNPTRIRSKVSTKENATDRRPTHSKSARKREKPPAVLVERPNKRQRRCDASQVEVQELRIEVKDLQSHCKRLESRSQFHQKQAQHYKERAQYQRERAKCHRERSQDDMKAIQGTVAGTKDTMANAINGAKTALKGLGSRGAVHEIDRLEHTDEPNEDLVQPLPCVSPLCMSIMLKWIIITVKIALLLLTNSKKNFKVENSAPLVRNLLRKVVTCASGPMTSSTTWSAAGFHFLGLTSAWMNKGTYLATGKAYPSTIRMSKLLRKRKLLCGTSTSTSSTRIMTIQTLSSCRLQFAHDVPGFSRSSSSSSSGTYPRMLLTSSSAGICNTADVWTAS
jgi:hypothetical protein